MNKAKVYLVTEKSLNDLVKQLPTLQNIISRKKFLAKQDSFLFIDGDETICIYGIDTVIKPYMLRHALAKTTRLLQKENIDELYVSTEYLPYKDDRHIIEIELGFILGNYTFDMYKTIKDAIAKPLIKLTIDGKHIKKEDLSFAYVLGNSIAYARDMINEPSNVLTPRLIAEKAMMISSESQGRISCEILSQSDCEKLGMGAYLAVNKGSSHEAQFIVLKYNTHKNTKTIALVGKTVTFDTGGVSIKPAQFMETMKCDMAGGATVLAIFDMLKQYKNEWGEIRYNVVGILPATDNVISDRSMVPDDVVKAMNGKTIEILNTDAEGRLTLADGLSYASDVIKADFIIDFATLTGAAMIALGGHYTAVFGNNKDFNQRLLDIFNHHDEKAWELPLPKEYKKYIESNIADLRNIGKTRLGDSILAGLFLQEFVHGNIPWIHLDIAGPAFNEEESYDDYLHGGTGWGIQSIMTLLTTHDKE